MVIRDVIRAAKKALKLAEQNPMLYSNEEIIYMKKSLRQAKIDLQETRDLMSKGFKPNATKWTSKTRISDTPSGTDDGVCSESEQSTEPGEP
jgi:hypothetical protein